MSSGDVGSASEPVGALAGFDSLWPSSEPVGALAGFDVGSACRRWRATVSRLIPSSSAMRRCDQRRACNARMLSLMAILSRFAMGRLLGQRVCPGAYRRIWVSSKWLVFKRPALAGFERPLTAVHVRANLMLRLADKERSDTADSYHLIAETLAEVDKTLLMLINPLQVRRSESDVALLKDMRAQIFMHIGDEDKLKERAEALWEKHASQQGFVLCARKLFTQAAATSRGKEYKKAFEYCQVAMNKCKLAGQTPAASLCEIALHIYYNWQVQRSTISSSGQTIYWELIRDHSLGALRAPGAYQEPFYKYLYGLALAHLNEWADARVIFTELRQLGMPKDVLWEPRDYLLNPEGGLRSLQGVMKAGAHGLFFYSEDLHLDFPADRHDDWPRPDEITHANIRFAFGGTTAVTVRSMVGESFKGSSSR